MRTEIEFEKNGISGDRLLAHNSLFPQSGQRRLVQRNERKAQVGLDSQRAQGLYNALCF